MNIKYRKIVRCVCGKYVVQVSSNKFCKHYGQALDWGDAV